MGKEEIQWEHKGNNRENWWLKKIK
jgi:hypothetical protein